MIGLYTHKVLNLSTTSLNTNSAENQNKTGHFHQKYWKSCHCDVIENITRFLILIHKNLDILLYKIVKSEKIG